VPRSKLGTTRSKPVPSNIKAFLKYLLVSIGVLILDHLTKYLATVYLKDSPPWPRGWTFFYFHYAENYHMAFSISSFSMVWVNLLGLVATGLVMFYLWRYARSARLPAWGMALILGGAFGNLSERFITGFRAMSQTGVFKGYVVDFISFDWPDWLYFYRWPTFNIADSAVTIGITLFIIYTLFFEHRPTKPVIDTNGN